MLHYDDKTQNYIWRYVHLLQYEPCEPPTCFGHLLWPSSGTCFYIIVFVLWFCCICNISFVKYLHEDGRKRLPKRVGGLQHFNTINSHPIMW